MHLVTLVMWIPPQWQFSKPDKMRAMALYSMKLLPDWTKAYEKKKIVNISISELFPLRVLSHTLTRFSAVPHQKGSRIRTTLENGTGHSIFYKIVCVPNEDSDQLAHPRSLIKVFAVSLKTLWIIDYPQNELRRLICICAGRTCPKTRFLMYLTLRFK